MLTSARGNRAQIMCLLEQDPNLAGKKVCEISTAVSLSSQWNVPLCDWYYCISKYTYMYCSAWSDIVLKCPYLMVVLESLGIGPQPLKGPLIS